MDRIDAGYVVVRTLGATDPREVATLGVVRIRVTPEFYAERLADIVTFKRTDDILHIGTFGEALPLLASPISRSMNGRSKASRVRSGQLRGAVVWRRHCPVLEGCELATSRCASASESCDATDLVDYVTRYRDAGTEASMQYADQNEALDVGREFASLLEADVETWQHFGDLRRHLLHYPMGPHLRRRTPCIGRRNESAGDSS